MQWSLANLSSASQLWIWLQLQASPEQLGQSHFCAATTRKVNKNLAITDWYGDHVSYWYVLRCQTESNSASSSFSGSWRHVLIKIYRRSKALRPQHWRTRLQRVCSWWRFTYINYRKDYSNRKKPMFSWLQGTGRSPCYLHAFRNWWQTLYISQLHMATIKQSTNWLGY